MLFTSNNDIQSTLKTRLTNPVLEAFLPIFSHFGDQWNGE